MNDKLRAIFLLAFSAGLFYLGAGAFRAGHYSARGGSISRRKTPVAFWFGMFVTFGFALGFAIVAIIWLLA